MRPPAKKRRVERATTNGDDAHDASRAAKVFCPITAPTVEEKAAWSGFCEIESEPAFFNVMLKDFGVEDVKVQEVFGLDEELLAMLPQPVYGLIFLYRYRSDDANNQEATCPDNVWFANQISDFSCATVSLLNIINNVPEIRLGEHLQRFKDFTRDFPPALKGEAISNFEFVKQIHNSFARRMDMLNIDLGLQNSYDDRRKARAAAAGDSAKKKKQEGRAGKNKGRVVSEDDYDEAEAEAAFHFSAYVPIDGEVWKLDGLDRQPQRLERFDNLEDWLSVAGPLIEAQMSAYAAGDIEFSLLGVVKDPLTTWRANLAGNIRTLRVVRARLDALSPDRETLRSNGVETSTQADGGVIIGEDAVLGITDAMLQAAGVDDVPEVIAAENDVRALEGRHADLAAAQQSLRRQVLDELNSNADDARRARERRHDYSPFIYTWLRMLAGKESLLAELVDSLR